MTEARRLTPAGIETFRTWLDAQVTGSAAPPELLHGPALSEPHSNVQFDETLVFASRFDFGSYLVQQLGTAELETLLAPESDGLWAWLSALYFTQLGAKRKRAEHYLVQRRGPVGSLAYRNGPRTCYELVAIHGVAAKVCLSGPMKTFGELTEAFASRQTVARNRAFFRTAVMLYFSGGKVRRGAGSKVTAPSKRASGDRRGFGASRRLSLAMQRLDLTWDTEEMDPVRLVEVLPTEFRRFQGDAGA